MPIARITAGRVLRMIPPSLQPLLAKRQLVIAAATVLLVILLVPFEGKTKVQPLARKFRLDNPYIAYPYVANELVPVWMLGALTFALPFFVLIGFSVLLERVRSHAALSALAFVFSTVASALAIEILKFLIGNQRPDFLARCAPHADAPLHEPLDVAQWCTSSNWARTWEGCRSTPSGHSAVSFNGMGFLAVWIIDTFGLLGQGTTIYAKLSGFSPLLISAFVAFSRIIDHKHHWFDVISGAVIGSATAFYVYKYVVKGVPPSEEPPLNAGPLTA